MLTIASYVRNKMRGLSIRQVVNKTKDKPEGKPKIGTATLHQITTGVTSKPTPDTLAELAKAFAEGNEELTRQYYAEMMSLCGYLDLLPEAKVEVAEPKIDEKAILDQLLPEVLAYAMSLKERSLEEYRELLLFFQEQEATRRAERH